MFVSDRPDRLLFGVFWQGGIGSDAAAAASSTTGDPGPGAAPGQAAVGGDAQGGATSDAGDATSSGLHGMVAVGPTSFGPGGGAPSSTTTGGRGGGGLGGQGFGGGQGGGFGGAGAATGAPTGGNAGGIGGGGHGGLAFGQQMGTPTQNVGGATLGLGQQGLLHGLANAAPSGTVTSSPLAPFSLPSLESLAQQGTTLGTPTPSLTDLATQLGFAPTLGGAVAGPNSLSANFGFPALAGVTPGLTDVPAGPSPAPGENVNAPVSPFAVPTQTPPPGIALPGLTSPEADQTTVTGLAPPTARIAQSIIANNPGMPYATAVHIALRGGTPEGEDPNPFGLTNTQDQPYGTDQSLNLAQPVPGIVTPGQAVDMATSQPGFQGGL